MSQEGFSLNVLQVEAAACAYEELRLHEALEAALAIANRGNLYMEEVAPWTAFKKVHCLRHAHGLLLLLHAPHRAALHITMTPCQPKSTLAVAV
jgi:methionyl-tRNA synthetase